MLSLPLLNCCKNGKNPIFVEKCKQLLKEEEENGKISIIPMYSNQGQEILKGVHYFLYINIVFNPIGTGLFSIVKNRGGAQCAQPTLQGPRYSCVKVRITKVALNDLLSMLRRLAFIFFKYQLVKSQNLNFK